MSTEPYQYQLLPELTADEYEGLKADIAERGVLVAVEYDEAGQILDGHHRVRAAHELGLAEWPSVVRGGMSEQEKRQHVWALNLQRRHLSKEQMREQMRTMRGDGMTHQAIADISGVSRNTVRRAVGPNGRTEPTTIIGKDGKHYPATRKRKAIVEHTASGVVGPYHIGPSTYPERGVYQGDCRELAAYIQEGEVDLVLSDPPYNIGFSKYDGYDDNMPAAEYIEMLAGLRKLAPVVLIQYPEETMRFVVPALGVPDHVGVWCYNSQFPRRFRLISYFGVKPDYSRIQQPYKNPTDKRVSALIRGGSAGTDMYEWWADIQIVKNVSPEKSGHPCPVPVKLMERIMRLVTEENAIVLDPFMGGGTTAEAAMRCKRRFLGFELSNTYVEAARKRLAITPERMLP